MEDVEDVLECAGNEVRANQVSGPVVVGSVRYAQFCVGWNVGSAYVAVSSEGGINEEGWVPVVEGFVDVG